MIKALPMAAGKIGALAALAAYFAIRGRYLTVDYFVDEADNLAGGRLIAEGYGLYRDFFSHHFPLPYWWLAGVFKLFGPSVFSARFSLLALEVLAWALVLRLTGRVRAGALGLVAWGLVQYLYWGHMAIYYSFSRVGFLVPFALVFLAPVPELDRLRTRLIIWAFTVMAVLADPFMAFPLGLVHLRWVIRRRKLLPYGRELLAALASSALGLGLLSALGTFSPGGLFSDAVVFNLQVYRKYAPAIADPAGSWLRNLASGLELFDRRWLNLDLLSPLDVDGASRRLFTGFFFRLAVLVLAVGLAVGGQVSDGLGVYAVSAALLARLPEYFHSGAFVMVALLAAALVADGLPGLRCIPVAGTGLRILVAGALAWLAFRSAAVLADPGLGEYHRQMVSWFEADARVAERLACGRRDVSLGVYPGGIYLNFLTGLRPAGGDGLLWPWMAEWGLDRVVGRLKTEPAVVGIHPDAGVGPFNAREYLRPLIEFLEGNYVAVDGFYVTPTVMRDCPSVRPYLNFLAAAVQRLDVPGGRPLVVLTDEPHLLDYVSKLSGRPVRGADPRSALLIPEGGGCFLAAPSWVFRELAAWELSLDASGQPGAGSVPWPLACSGEPGLRGAVAVWEGGVALGRVKVRGELRPGGELEVVALWWEEADLGAQLHVFHHLLGDGQLIAQADGPLDGGFGRRPGDLIGTRYQLRLPERLEAGHYDLLVGLYRFPELARLKTAAGTDAVRVGP